MAYKPSAAIKFPAFAGNPNNRTCYSCGAAYPGNVRFCPTDGVDLDYDPPQLEDLARDFHQPRTKPTFLLLFLILAVMTAISSFGPGLSEAETASVGDLTIRTTPPGAIVYLDGSKVGASPMLLSDIPIGVHEVRAIFPGYTDGKRQVEIIPSETQKLIWTLTPLPRKRTMIRRLA